MKKEPSIQELVSLVKSAAAAAADHQERSAAEDVEARKIVNIMEEYLRIKGRIVYGGAAINAHLSAETKFYDPRLYLPDYDFMTPDPLQDSADLIVKFQQEGFTEVEAKFGIHEGTYKIFVNFRPAADITYMPPDLYSRTVTDASTIEGIRYASPDFLRMNMYTELSQPAGNVSRWEKVYERLLLLNREHPIRPGHCPLKHRERPHHNRIQAIGIEHGAVFLSESGIILMMSDKAPALVKAIGLKTRHFEAQGELLPARTELLDKDKLVAVVFETVTCHAYVMKKHSNARLGSTDLLIRMYYAMHFAGLNEYVPGRLVCVIQTLIDLETMKRKRAVGKKDISVFPQECIGHQPTMPELKRAHRERVLEKRKELMHALKASSGVRLTRRRRKL